MRFPECLAKEAPWKRFDPDSLLVPDEMQFRVLGGDYCPTFDEVVMESINMVSVSGGNPVHVGVEALYGRTCQLPMKEVRNGSIF